MITLRGFHCNHNEPTNVTQHHSVSVTGLTNIYCCSDKFSSGYLSSEASRIVLPWMTNGIDKKNWFNWKGGNAERPREQKLCFLHWKNTKSFKDFWKLSLNLRFRICNGPIGMLYKMIDIQAAWMSYIYWYTLQNMLALKSVLMMKRGVYPNPV